MRIEQIFSDIITALKKVDTPQEQKIAMAENYVTRVTADDHTLLGYAAESNDAEVVAIVLAALHASVTEEQEIARLINMVGQYGATAIKRAADKGNIEIVRQLLAQGCDVDATKAGHATALLEAINQGYLDIAQLLLEKGANIKATNERDRNAFEIAANKANQAALELLIKMWPAQSGPITPYLEAALRAACSSAHLGIVKFLSTKAIDLNATDASGFSGLMLAARAGHKAIVEFLIPNATPGNINQAFVHSIQYYLQTKKAGKAKGGVTKVLLEQGHADINSLDQFNQSALLILLDDPDFFKEFVTHYKDKINLNVECQDKETILSIAVNKKIQWAVEFLLAEGADPNVINANGRHLLQAAAEDWHIFIAVLEKLCSVKTDCCEVLNSTLLFLAGSYNSFSLMEKLIEKGADINATDAQGNTPLMIALLNRQMNNITAILNLAAANVSHENGDGSNALTLAASSGMLNAVKIIVEKYPVAFSAESYLQAFSAVMRYQGVNSNLQQSLAIVLLKRYCEHADFSVENIPNIQTIGIAVALEKNQVLFLESLLKLPVGGAGIEFSLYALQAVQNNSAPALDLLLNAMVRNGESIYKCREAWLFFTEDASGFYSEKTSGLRGLLTPQAIAKRYLDFLSQSSANDVSAAVMQAALPYKSEIVSLLIDKTTENSVLKNSVKRNGLLYENGLSKFMHETRASWLMGDDSVEQIKAAIKAREPKVVQSHPDSAYGNNSL